MPHFVQAMPRKRAIALLRLFPPAIYHRASVKGERHFTKAFVRLNTLLVTGLRMFRDSMQPFLGYLSRSNTVPRFGVYTCY